METVELEAQIYRALTEDAALMALLSDGSNSVFYLRAPGGEAGRYPILVYSPISDVPIFAADDVEAAHRVTFRIHIVTLDGQYGGIYRRVHHVMEGLGFTRTQTTPYVEGEEKMLVVDYKIGVSAEWQR